MSPMQQMELPFADGPAQPAPRPDGPAIWIARLLLLRAPELGERAVIRDVRLRRGLNILWAPPSATEGENRLFEGRITGHTAGKTTFCRMIRYLLGEERFGTTRAQDRIRARLPDGWVAGEVVVGGERWAVGRPFARSVHPFAARGLPLDAALQGREGYQDFLAAVAAATVADLPVRTLPHARRPIDWPLALTWLARDQEARFAGPVDWRHPASESESPSPKVADRHVALRAMLDLMSDEEAALQRTHEALKERRKHLEDEGALLRRRADEDRRRLAAELGVSPDEGEAGPLFAACLRERIDADRAAVERDEAALPELQAAAERALEALTRAAEERAVRDARLRDAEQQLAAGEAARGRCNVPLALAIARGCPLALDTPAPAAARDPGDELAEARRAREEADATHRERHAEYQQASAALQEERARLARKRASIEEKQRLHGYSDASQGAARTNEEALEGLAAEADKLSRRKAARQRQHAGALRKLSDRFGEVVQALLGRTVQGWAEVSGGEIELHIAEHGERDGAAMETLKVLGFDLAALSLGMDGHGHFPGFLLHDGPREADMDELIYERLFLYATEELEGSDPEPAFQYIVTTTAPPPARLQKAPWLLDLPLDASVPERRLLGMDL